MTDLSGRIKPYATEITKSVHDGNAKANQIRLRELIAKARAEKKWLYANNLAGEFWYSPDQLAAESANGKSLWGAINWQLRDPEEYVEQARKRLNDALADYIRVQKEVA